MTIRRGFLNWGIFLICLGAVPLAVQLGVIDASAAEELLRLWPLILIGIGLGLLLRLTPYAALGGVVVAATFGLLLGSLLGGGVAGVSAACIGSPPNSPSTTRDGTISSSELGFQVEVTCAELNVARQSGAAWHVDVAASGEQPTIDSGAGQLSLRSDNGGGWGPFGGNSRERWNVTLPAEPALDASLTVNAGSANFDFGGGAVDNVSATYNAADGSLKLANLAATTPANLSMTLNASSLDLSLPATSMNGEITLNAASLNACVPSSVGLRIEYHDTLSSDNFGSAGLGLTNGAWQTADFASADTRIDLRLSANVSSITLDRSGGCQ